MTEQGIVPVESVSIMQAPAEVLKSATEAALALADVVSRKPKRIIVNGEQYLEYEDWQTVGHFFGLHAKTEDAQPVTVAGVEGAKARATIVNRDGMAIGGAEAYCLRDEDKWKNKPWFQLASMAQTRAASKAFSNILRWVVVLAGYKGTPAEEMADEKPAAIPVEHYCKEHKTEWFKRGNMKSYAHPIEGTDPKQWCNEPADEPAREALFPPETSKTTIPPSSQPPAAQTGPLPAKKGTRAVILPDSVESVDAAQKIAEQCGMNRDTFVQVLGDNGLSLKSTQEQVWKLIKPLLG